MKRAFPGMAVLFCCMIFCMTGCGSSEKSDSGAKEEKTVKKQEQQNEKEEEKESEKESEILQFVDVYGQQYSVEINQNIAKKQYNDTLFMQMRNILPDWGLMFLTIRERLTGKR